MLELSPGRWAAPWGTLGFPTWPSPQVHSGPLRESIKQGKLPSRARSGGQDLEEAGPDRVALRNHELQDTSPELRSRCVPELSEAQVCA